MSELKSCPFCGSTDIDIEVGPAACRNCWCQGPHRYELACDWNTRAPDPAIAALQAEVARWQQLYEDARHDLTKAGMEVERLREEMLRERD